MNTVLFVNATVGFSENLFLVSSIDLSMFKRYRLLEYVSQNSVEYIVLEKMIFKGLHQICYFQIILGYYYFSDNVGNNLVVATI